MEEKTLRLGRITSAHGIRGEVKVYLYTDFPQRFEEAGYVIADGRRWPIDGLRELKGMLVLKLAGVDSRNEAEVLRGQDLFIREEDAAPLPEDTYYVRDLIGLAVVDAEGRRIGRLAGVEKYAAQDLYEIKKDDGSTFRVPAVEEFVKEVDPAAGRIVVQLIEGLEDL